MNDSIRLKLDPLRSKPTINQSKDSLNYSISIMKPKHVMELYGEDLLDVLNINYTQNTQPIKKTN